MNIAEVGETVTFVLGFHLGTGVVVRTGVVSVLVQVAPEVFELVYADELVTTNG